MCVLRARDVIIFVKCVLCDRAISRPSAPSARLGSARRGSARLGLARPASNRPLPARLSLARRSSPRLITARRWLVAARRWLVAGLSQLVAAQGQHSAPKIQGWFFSRVSSSARTNGKSPYIHLYLVRKNNYDSIVSRFTSDFSFSC